MQSTMIILSLLEAAYQDVAGTDFSAEETDIFILTRFFEDVLMAVLYKKR